MTADTIRWHDGVLLALLCVLAAVNLLGVGSYKGPVYLIALLALVKGYVHLRGHPRAIAGALWLAAVPVVFVVLDTVNGQGIDDKNATRNLLAFLAIASGAALLPVRWPAPWQRLAAVLPLLTLTLVTAGQSVALLLGGRPFGLFDNPHFLALGAALTVPVAVHGWRQGALARVLAVTACVAAVINLLCIGSVIGWLALLAAAAVAVGLRLPRRWRTGAALGAAVVVVAVLAYPPLHGWYDAPTDWVMDRLLPDQDRDERFGLWRDAWTLQHSASDPVQWLAGHGLGGFAADFDGFSRYAFVFPHHFLLEVLYNSGLLGLGVFLAAAAALTRALLRALVLRDALVVLAACLLAAAVTFTFLTLPVTARPTSHTLGLTIGFALWALRTTGLQRGAGQ